MTTQTQEEQDQVVYPETDGKPMAENTLQYEWITTIKGNLDILFRDDPNVFIAGDLFWYPVEGQPGTRAAPDVLVVFGRPTGHRRSYRQWREGGVAPQVVFEIQSPSNRPEELDEKFEFYDRHGVEEYYLYDPEQVELSGWRRRDGRLQPVLPMNGWTSPRLSIRFDLSGADLVLYRPDGTRFQTILELDQEMQTAVHRAEEEAPPGGGAAAAGGRGRAERADRSAGRRNRNTNGPSAWPRCSAPSASIRRSRPNSPRKGATMARMEPPRIAVLGAGPVGLEAALYASALNLPFTVYERGRVGEHLRRWGHVRLFSPFGMNSTPLGRARIRADQPQHPLPEANALLTGREHVAAYLEPLALSPALTPAIRENTAVLHVGRRGLLKEDYPGDARRGQGAVPPAAARRQGPRARRGGRRGAGLHRRLRQSAPAGRRRHPGRRRDGRPAARRLRPGRRGRRTQNPSMPIKRLW